MVARPSSPQSRAADVAASAGRFRVALRFAVDGDLRYLAHHDELRMLSRALVRARWPVAYSRGYNPLPRITLPLPRSLGTASTCEWALVDLSEPRPASELEQTLAATLPRGCTLYRVIAPAPAATPRPCIVSYCVELTPADATRIEARLRGLLAASAVPAVRRRGPHKSAPRLDIRPYIQDIVCDGQNLRMRLTCEQQRSARPSEILTALGFDADEYVHRIRRTDVKWNIELTGPPLRPAALERNTLGQEDKYNRAQATVEEDTPAADS